MTRTWKALFGRVGEFNARIEENVGGIRVVQAFANEDHERRLFAGANAGYRKTKLEAYRVMTTSTILSYFSMRLTQIVVMIAGRLLRGGLYVPGLVASLRRGAVIHDPTIDVVAADGDFEDRATPAHGGE